MARCYHFRDVSASIPSDLWWFWEGVQKTRGKVEEGTQQRDGLRHRAYKNPGAGERTVTEESSGEVLVPQCRLQDVEGQEETQGTQSVGDRFGGEV